MQRLFLIISTAAVLLTLPLNLRGLEYGGLGGRPANPNPAIPNSQNWFIYELAAGTVKEDAVIISNGGTEPVTALIYPADATRSSDGGFALKQQTETMTGVGSWVRLYPNDRPTFAAGSNTSIIEWCGSSLDGNGSRANRLTPTQKLELIAWCRGVANHELTIEGGREISLPFIMSAPPGLSVGEHTGGIVIQKKQPTADLTESGIQITTRVGVRIYQTVPGTVKKELRISGFNISPAAQPGYYTVTLSLSNGSSVSLNQLSRISITNLWTRQHQTIERPGQVLHDDELVINFPLKKPFLGRLRLQATVTYDVDGQPQLITSRIIHVTNVHWSLLIILVLVLISIGGMLIKRRRAHSNQETTRYTVKAHEDVSAIADRFHLSWQQLAKLNQLKPPYRLTPGQVLIIPKQKTSRTRSTSRKNH